MAIALTAATWLMLGLRALDLEEDGARALERAQEKPLSAEELNRALEGLQDSRRLSASNDSMLTEASLLAAAGRPLAAARVSRRMVEQEPENDRAWFVAYLNFTGESRAQARRRVAELNPWAADGLP